MEYHKIINLQGNKTPNQPSKLGTKIELKQTITHMERGTPIFKLNLLMMNTRMSKEL